MEKKKTTPRRPAVKKQQGSVRVLNLESAIQTDYPSITVDRKRWVSYGTSNEYPDYLMDLFLESPTNNAVITAVSQMIAGDGLDEVDTQGNPIGNAQLQELFTPKSLKKIAFNLKLFGYAPVIVFGGSRVDSIQVSDALKWRSGKEDENGNITEWYFSNDWSNTHSAYGRPVEYQVFTDQGGEQEQVFIFSLPLLGLDYYPAVDYSGGTNYIALEAEIGLFHLAAIQNGLNPSTIINFNNGVPPDDVQDSIEKKVMRKFGGASNAGRFFLSFNDSNESASTFETAAVTNIDKQYDFLSKESQSKIFVAHRVTSPLLFGVRDTGGGLGNNANELEQSYNLYFETVIRPYQELILDGVEAILFKNGTTIEADWIQFNPFGEKEEAAETQRENTGEEVQEQTDTVEENLSAQVPEGFQAIYTKVYNGEEPKNNGHSLVLFRRKLSNPKNRKIKLSQEDYYDHEYVKRHPNNRDYYWEATTFVKPK